MDCALKEAVRPKSLHDVIGQPCVRQLRALARNPRPCCVALVGPPGVGKSASASALANDLGCSDDGWGQSKFVECATTFSVEHAEWYFGPQTPFKYHGGAKGVHILILEELESLHPTVQGILKTVLDPMPEWLKLILVATSNGLGKFTKTATARALLQRFDILNFEAGPCFMDAYNDKLPGIWAERMGADTPMPPGWQSWGLDGDDFSARLALSMCERYIRAAELDTEEIYA